MENKPIYKTTSFFAYFIPSMFLTATIVAYFLNVHLFVVLILGFVALANLFKDHLSVIVYEDHFNICYSNITGKLMSIDNVYYFKDITHFSFKTYEWKPNLMQSIIMVIVELLLKRRGAINKGKPQTTVLIHTKNELGETKNIELNLETKDSDIIKGLNLIQTKCE